MQIINGNYIDLIIIAIIVYFIFGSFRHNFWHILTDFMSFLGSLVLSFKFYRLIAEFLKINFSLATSVSNALGFLFAAVIFESLLSFLLNLFVRVIPKKIRDFKYLKFFSVIPALGEGLILVAFLLTLVISLPIKPQVKADITNSSIGGYVLEKSSNVEGYINEVFGGVISDSLTYFTVKPDSKDSVTLEVSKFDLVVDEKAESEMFWKVNEERRKLGLPELKWRPELVPVARDHARDMWERKYFSHYSPDGDDVGDRLHKNKVKYFLAGENLALAPTVSTAHTGLMNSQGHRENILHPDFKQIGIGVIDNGYYGKMFVQVFSD